MTTWFIADTHFGHKRIIELANRPFTCVEQMDEKLITNWNYLVRPNDVVFVLGDFSFHNLQKTGEIFFRLAGKKHLIRGNHDEKRADKLPWTDVKDYFVLKQDHVRIVLSHFPFLSWRHMQKGDLHLHGHCHGNLKAPLTRREDVGVDTLISNFYPVAFETIVDELQDRPLYECDGHLMRRTS